jgi:serine/threonine protein kinase
MSRPETLQKKYVGKLSKRALNIIRALLNMESASRPSSEECLQHPYFENLDRKYNPTSNTAINNSSSKQDSNGNTARGGYDDNKHDTANQHRPLFVNSEEKESSMAESKIESRIGE